MYNAFERQVDYGWVDACTVRTWRAGSPYEPPLPVLVTLYTEYNPKVHQECVSPSAAKTWSVSGAFEYRVRAAVHRQSCDEAAVATHVGKATMAADKASIKLTFDAKTKRFALGN